MGKHNVDELKKNISGITLTAVICLAMIVIGLNVQVASVKADDVPPPPTLKVVPSQVEAYPGETFDVNITINDLFAEWNLSGYDVYLHYGTDLLGVVDVIPCEFFEDFAGPSGTFNVTHFGDDYYPWDFNSETSYDDVGVALVACALLGDHATPQGSGTLATITFQWDATEWSVEQLVCCDLVIEAKLADSNANPIPFTTIDGQFCPKEVPLLKVVASEVEVYPGETFDVNVTIDDLAAEWDLRGFEVRIYYDTTVLNATDVVVGPFLQPFAGPSGTLNETHFGDDYYPWDFNSETSYDDVGCALAASVLLGDHATPHGSGILATITFVFEQVGGSALRLERKIARAWPFPAALVDSEMRIIPCTAIHSSVPEMPILTMVPSEATVSLGQAFNVDITINNLRVEWDLAGWDFRLWYNTDVLDVINVVEGPFLESFAGSDGTYIIAKFGDDWLPPHSYMTYEKGGLVGAMCAFRGEHTTPEGTGILATITFNATWMGESALEFEWLNTVTNQTWLYPAKLADETRPDAKTIPCAAVSGHVSIGPAFPDLNDDGLVDVFDGVIMAIAYGTKPGDLKWNARADVNRDNIIDIFDLMIWASHYGETTP